MGISKINIHLLPQLLVLAVFTFSCTGNQSGRQSADRPNIVIIMADDLGYSDAGCYGGEINTPHIDRLAENGLRFTRFYNAARCCPTRASLLTGVYQHQAGLARNGNSLTDNVVTLAEVLQESGYHTGMTGKWHLSETRGLEDHEEQLKWLSHRIDHSPFAPVETYPCNRGFDEHYGVIWGVVDFFDPFSLVHNETPIETVPDDFYITDFISNKSVDLIEKFNRDEEPFFLYVAYTAPHWPLHARSDDIARYDGMYDEGWGALRKARYDRMTALGIIEPETAPLAPNESGRSWTDEPYKAWEANHMETHAAMVDRMDQGIGRIIQKLEESGQLENTVIFFLADNGASPERGFPPGFDRPGHKRNGEEITYLQPGDGIQPGPQDTWGYLGDAWAGAVNAPFRYWKKESFHGGVCTPFIVHWPGGMKTGAGEITGQAGHIIDVMPTLLELTGTTYPQEYNGHKILPPEGKSLVDIFEGKQRDPHKILFWEHEGGKAVVEGDWKIAALRDREWELFNLADDFTETTDLRDQFPEKVSDLEKKWEAWYESMMDGTIP